MSFLGWGAVIVLETRLIETVDGALSVLGPRCSSLSKAGKGLLKSLRALESSVSAFSIEAATKLGDECVAQVEELAKGLAECRECLRTLTPGRLDEEAYRSAFEAECRRIGLNLSGHFPRYEAFPLEVVFRLTDGIVDIGGRAHRELHPRAVASTIQDELKVLTRHPFNPARFRTTLIRVYDLLVAESALRNSRPLLQVGLRDIHKLLSVLAPKDGYSVRQFAFDLYRLRQHPEPQDGRQLHFGELREHSRAIAVPDPTGTRYLGYLEVRRTERT